MNLIKKGHILFLTALLTLCFVSCDDDDDGDEYGNWVEKSSFGGDNRSSAVSFTIGTKGYAGTGYDGDDELGDFWEYDSETNTWTEEKIDVMGFNNDDPKNAKVDAKPRQGAVAFSIGNKGYVGTGYDGEDELNDFWEFDPTAATGKQWKRIADFGASGPDVVGLKRRGAIGFSLNGKGYVGTGYYGSAKKDFWEYDPETNKWTEIGFIGNKRQDATVFVINDKAYIGTGLNNGALEEDFYSFDGKTFTELTDLDDEDEDNEVLLYNGVGFSINGKGYITTGVSNSTSTATWEYTPETDTWDEVPEFQGNSRQNASAFTFDSTAFVFLGQNGSYFDDNYEFKPDELENEDD